MKTIKLYTNLSFWSLLGLLTVETPANAEVVVKPGDTLISIARDALGQASAWRRLCDENSEVLSGNCSAIYPGMVLKLPQTPVETPRETLKTAISPQPREEDKLTAMLMIEAPEQPQAPKPAENIEAVQTVEVTPAYKLPQPLNGMLSQNVDDMPVAGLTAQISLAECINQEFDISRLDYDPLYPWLQRHKTELNDFTLNETSQKALSEIRQFFKEHDVELVVSIMPTPLFGHPSNSLLLNDQFQKQSLQESYEKALNSLTDLNISAPNLTELYSLLPNSEVQRSFDNHLSSYGTWASGAVVALNLEESSASSKEALTRMLQEIDTLPRRDGSYSPSKIAQEALTENCLETLGSIPEVQYYLDKRHDDQEPQSSSEQTDRPDVVISGTSYSSIFDSLIARSIEYFSGKSTLSIASAGLGPLSSFEFALRARFREVTNSSFFVWEMPDPSGLNNALSALMVLKGVEQPSCSPESALYQDGYVDVDQNGKAKLPIIGVNENRLELFLPEEEEQMITVTFGDVDNDHLSVELDRNFTVWGDEAPSYLGYYSFWLPGYNWFPEMVPNNYSLELKIEQPRPLPSSVRFVSCATGL